MWFFKFLIIPEPMKLEGIKKLSELKCKWSFICIPLIFFCERVKCPPFILPPNTDHLDQSYSIFLSNAFKYDFDYPDVLSHLIPSQMKIKGIHIKLHLQVSSLNFLIPFPKILIIYQWNGKNFSIGENGMTPVAILPISECFAKRPKRYVFLAHIY